MKSILELLGGSRTLHLIGGWCPDLKMMLQPCPFPKYLGPNKSSFSTVSTPVCLFCFKGPQKGKPSYSDGPMYCILYAIYIYCVCQIRYTRHHVHFCLKGPQKGQPCDESGCWIAATGQLAELADRAMRQLLARQVHLHSFWERA